MANPLLTLAGSEYARKRRDIFNLIKDLRALGADTEIDLPRIAVIGGQSAGKSSLVEAITGINVPRDSGTCTRCPVECTILTNQGDWTCNISLRTSSHDGGSNPGQTIQTPFATALTDKNDVEIWLRRAQAAILSPHKNSDAFKTMTYEELRESISSDSRVLKFSRDVVVIDIQDPEGTDLSFIDLPGLIRNEDPEVVTLVKDLVEFYINQESTIVLVTVPAGDDMEVVEAARLARDADPDGERTIAVVTKPDSLTAGARGARQRWSEIFQGHNEKHKLRLGYYAVRLPDDDERARNITRLELDNLAQKYFNENSPWKELVDSNRLGLPNFITDISKVLMRIIEKSLPRLRENARTKLAACLHDISKLPEEITVDATTEVLNRVSNFCADIQRDTNGQNESKTFVHQCRRVFKHFKFAIRSTAPDFRPFINPNSRNRTSDPRSQSDSLDKDLRGSVQTHPRIKTMGLTEVRKVIEDSIGWELPHNVPFEAKVRLIKMSLDLWQEPVKICFDSTHDILSSLVDDKIHNHFWQFRALEQHIGSLIRSELHEQSTRAWIAVSDVLEREKYPYWTQNNHYLESASEAWLTQYRDIKKGRIAYEYTTGESDSSHAYPSSERSMTLVQSPILDPYEDELIVMAHVRAYFQVAYKRIIDNVSLAIHRDLSQLFCDGLQRRLIAKLDLDREDAPQRLAQLVAEDPAVTLKRQQLQRAKERLEEMHNKLEDISPRDTIMFVNIDENVDMEDDNSELGEGSLSSKKTERRWPMCTRTSVDECVDVIFPELE